MPLVGNPFSEDEYVRKNRPRSVLCLPIVKQGSLVGALYLENNLTPHAFTSSRVTVLELLASQAAISLENAALYSDLRHSQAYLAEAQGLSQTGSFGRNVRSGKIVWSDEVFRIFGYDRAASVTLDMVLQRVHPDDAARVRQTVEHASQNGTDYALEYRLLMPDGAIKHVHVVARANKQRAGQYRVCRRGDGRHGGQTSGSGAPGERTAVPRLRRNSLRLVLGNRSGP